MCTCSTMAEGQQVHGESFEEEIRIMCQKLLVNMYKEPRDSTRQHEDHGVQQKPPKIQRTCNAVRAVPAKQAGWVLGTSGTGYHTTPPKAATPTLKDEPLKEGGQVLPYTEAGQHAQQVGIVYCKEEYISPTDAKPSHSCHEAPVYSPSQPLSSVQQDGLTRKCSPTHYLCYSPALEQCNAGHLHIGDEAKRGLKRKYELAASVHRHSKPVPSGVAPEASKAGMCAGQVQQTGYELCPQERSQQTEPEQQATLGIAAPGAADSSELLQNLHSCSARLTEVFDQQLLQCGNTDIDLILKLRSGTYGSVYIGYTVLNQLKTDGTLQSSSPVNIETGGEVLAEMKQRPLQDGPQIPPSASPGVDSSGSHLKVRHVAVKVYRAADADFYRELRALKLSLGKRYIVQLLAVGHVAPHSLKQEEAAEAPQPSQPSEFPCLVLQLNACTLEDIKESCSEKKARQWIEQLLHGLAALHSGGADQGQLPSIVLSTLNPLSILLDENDDMLIGDFSGCSFSHSNSSITQSEDATCHVISSKPPCLTTVGGSECYMAPEIGNPTFASYDCTVDSHSVGVIALSLLLGGRKQLMQHAKQLPAGVSMQTCSIMHYLQDIILGYEQPQLAVSGDFRNFLECSTTVGARQTPAQLLQHPWIVGGHEARIQHEAS